MSEAVETCTDQEVLVIEGDVDVESGDVESEGDVTINGAVREGMVVKSKGSITVAHVIESAEVEADVDVTVNGGIVGKEKGKVVAGRHLTAKFTADVTLQAKREIRVESSLINSILDSGTRLKAPRAKVVGGRMEARYGVIVNELGNDKRVPTSVCVGVRRKKTKTAEDEAEELERISKLKDEKVERDEQLIKKLDRTSDAIRTLIEQAMETAGAVSEEHKEQAETFLSKAEHMKKQADLKREVNKKAAEVSEPRGTADVLVLHKVWPGVSVTVDDRETTFHQEMNGPIRIEKRKMERVSEIVAIHQVHGSVTRLKSIRVKV